MFTNNVFFLVCGVDEFPTNESFETGTIREIFQQLQDQEVPINGMFTKFSS